MLAEHDGRTLPGMTIAPLEAAHTEPNDRSMAIMQWLTAFVAVVAAILLASVR